MKKSVLRPPLADLLRKLNLLKLFRILHHLLLLPVAFSFNTALAIAIFALPFSNGWSCSSFSKSAIKNPYCP